MATKEKEPLYCCQVQLCFQRHSDLERTSHEIKKTLSDSEIDPLWKAVCCIGASQWGILDELIEYSKDKPDILRYLCEDFGGKEDRHVFSLGIAAENEQIAQTVLDHLVGTGHSFLSPEFIEAILNKYPTLTLTKRQKDTLIREAISGSLSTEEVALCEKMAGRSLTKSQRKRYGQNRFRDLVDCDDAVAPEFVWNELKRSLSHREKGLLQVELQRMLAILERNQPRV